MAFFVRGHPNGEPCPAFTLPRISTPRSSSRNQPVTTGSVSSFRVQEFVCHGQLTGTDHYDQEDFRYVFHPTGPWSVHHAGLDGPDQDHDGQRAKSEDNCRLVDMVDMVDDEKQLLERTLGRFGLSFRVRHDICESKHWNKLLDKDDLSWLACYDDGETYNSDSSDEATEKWS